MKSIELFAGAGGLALGFSHAGFSPVAVVEINRDCLDTLSANRSTRQRCGHDWPLIQGDVRETNFSEHEGRVTLVTGGPPCQPFSIGGKHRASDDCRDMFPQAVRVVKETAPKAFLFENVKGLTRANFSDYFDYVKKQLSFPEVVRHTDETWKEHLSRLRELESNWFSRGLSYQVHTAVLNAANFGVPQKRERVFIVGVRNDLNVQWEFPKETHSYDGLLWNQLQADYWDRHKVPLLQRLLTPRAAARADRITAEPRQLPWVTVRDALAGLPDPEKDSEASMAFHNHEFQPGARKYVGHTGSPFDEPAKTLKAGVHGVPGGENMLLRSDGSVRYFTVRESARLQCFPDSYVILGSWSEAMRQLGNAVPVRLAEILANQLRMLVDGKKMLVAAE